MFTRFIQPSLKTFAKVKLAIHNKFSKYPSATSALTGCVMFGSGEYITQRILHEENTEMGGLGRVLELGCLGFIMNGFFLTQWYRLLDRVVGVSMKCNKVVAIKVISDQFLFAPFCIMMFFGFTAAVQQNSWKEMKENFIHRMEHSFWPTYFADCTVWPLANYINFKIVPGPYRPTWTAVVQFVWQIYMSYVSKEAMEEDEDGDEETEENVVAIREDIDIQDLPHGLVPNNCLEA